MEQQTSGEPLTPAQLASYARPGDPDLTRDGSRVAYVLTPVSKAVDKDNEHGVSTIWVVDVAGGEPRQFTSGLWEDREPRWSPDGTRLAFLSDRAKRGKKSVYLIPADGGEGVRVFDQQGSISTLRWSPDGRYLSFTFTDPETPEEKEQKENKDDVKVWDAELKWRRLWLIDLEDGNAARAISPDGRQVWSYAWSADGRQLAINTSPNPRLNDVFGETRVDIIDVEAGTTRELMKLRGTAESMVWDASGGRIAYLSTGGHVLHNEHMFVVPTAGGEPCNVTPDLDGTFEMLVPIDGGAALLGKIAYGVNFSARRVEWDGEIGGARHDGDPWGNILDAPAPSGDGERVAFVWEDGAHSPNIWVQDAAARSFRQLTDHNPELDAAALGKQEIIQWESDGVTIEGLLLTPPGYEEGQQVPLVVQVHGGPTWHWSNAFFADWHDWGQYLAGQGFAVLLHNPRGSTGYGSQFMNALVNEIGGVEYRDLIAGVDALIERGIADPDRLGIGGWSWGGYMTAWAVTQTDRFKAAVMGAGLPNMVSDNSIGDIPGANLSYFDVSMFEDADPFWERSPIRYIRNCNTPVLILHGEADERVNMYESVEMYVALRELGREHQFVTYPREGHGIRERKHQIDLLERIGAWYKQRL